MIRLGYACINMSLNESRKKKDFITVNRGMVKKTFESKGLSYVSELFIKNLKDTFEILKWNKQNNILVYRLSSDFAPWFSEYNFEDLPNFNKISNLLKGIGSYVKQHNMRVGFHPGPYSTLASEKPDVRMRAIKDINQHALLLDLMDLEQSTYYPINIHVGNTKPSLEEAAKRFCVSFELLSNSAKRRLVIENDDSPNQFSVKNLYELIHSKLYIPITLDFHHFNYGPQDTTLEEAINLAFSTWGSVRPLTHMSSSKKIEDESARATAHADYIYEKIPVDGDFDCELEAKAKDLAVIKYKENHGK